MKVWMLVLYTLYSSSAFCSEFFHIKLDPDFEHYLTQNKSKSNLSKSNSKKSYGDNEADHHESHTQLHQKMMSALLGLDLSQKEILPPMDGRESTLYLEIRRHLENAHQSIGQLEVQNINRFNEEFNLGQSNFSGFSWQRPFGVVQVHTDRQVTPNVFGTNWLVMDTFTFEIVSTKLGLPLFVKPANAGSSVGVHKVLTAQEYETALGDSFLYDRKILVEEAIPGIEIEVAILGNEFPKASAVGAIVPTEAFYSFEAKYISSTGAKLLIPAPIPTAVSKRVRNLAIKAFQCIGAEGLSRVDFFLKEDETLVLNEINTLPGFTSISMYPKLWEASGVNYSKLLDRLIQLGIKRHQKIRKLKTTW
jgi:hypothetical protein